MNNNQRKLWVGLFIALIALVAGVSYAYFTASFENLGTRETAITASTMGSLKLTATEATYTSGSQYPGDIAIQKFEVEPISQGKGVYELDLTGVIDETIFGTDVEIQLYKSIDSTEVTVTEGELTQEGSNFSRVDTLVTNGLTPVYTQPLKNGLNILFQEEFEVIDDNGTLKIRDNSESTAYPKYTFYLVYNYKNNGNQNNQMGQTFNGTISGKLIQEIKLTGAQTIAKLVDGSDSTSTAVIDNGTDESGCTNTLAYDDFGNLRYVGANPCNYVTFNNETWRIIGVFGDKIKLIRNESIGAYSWDTSASSVNKGNGINQWGESGTYTGADLMKLLNPGYETNLAENASGSEITGTYANNSLYWNRGSGNCYNNSNNTYTTCDFSTTGLSESAKSMIANATWNLGSTGNNDVSSTSLGTASKFYEFEHGSIVKTCSSSQYCNDTVDRNTVWQGYVGLSSASDYGYAVGGLIRNYCLSNVSLYYYDNPYYGLNEIACSSDIWLKKIYDWILNPSGEASAVFRSYGFVRTSNAGYSNDVTPSLFLIPSIEISEGNGSPTNPYVLSTN